MGFQDPIPLTVFTTGGARTVSLMNSLPRRAKYPGNAKAVVIPGTGISLVMSFCSQSG